MKRNILLERRIKRLENMLKTNESLAFNEFDVQNIEKQLEKSLPKDCFIDISDDNANRGFVNVGIEYDGAWFVYDIIVNNYNDFEVDYNDHVLSKNITTLFDACKLIAKHYKANI